mgnify:FL=1
MLSPSNSNVIPARNAPLTQPSYWVNASLSSLEEIQEFERTPLLQRKLPQSTYEFLQNGCAIDPDGIAIHYFADAARCAKEHIGMTFKEVFDRITQTANLFHALGVRSEDVISLMIPNIPESQFALWGAQAAGIANPINWMLEPAAIVNLLKAAGTKVLVAYGGDASIDIWDKVLQIQMLMPQLQTLVRLGGDRSGKVPSDLHFIEYLDVVDRYQSTGLVSGRVFCRDDIASFFPTGGTTSAPKLARHTHANEVISAWLSATVSGLQAGEARLSATPLFHVVGAMATSLATLGRGARLVMATSGGWRNPDVLANFWQIVETFRLSVAPMVPTILNQLIRSPVGGFDMSSLRLVTSGSAPLSEYVAREFHRLTNKYVCEGYGMTETTSVIIMNPCHGTAKAGSVGLRFPYHHVRIIASDRSKGIVDCAKGDYGVLAIAGAAVFPGYVESTMDADLWIDDRWLNTGDLAREDEDGYIWITGRVKDLIIRGGHNIDPKPVEEVFYCHPDVIEAGVVGRPDAHAGEVPVAYVAVRPGATVTPEELLEYARVHISERAAIPKDCYLMEALPKSSIGKVLKSQLRTDATSKAFVAALGAAGLNDSCSVRTDDLGVKGVVCTVQIHNSLVTGEQVRKALSQFTVRYEIQNTSA